MVQLKALYEGKILDYCFILLRFERESLVVSAGEDLTVLRHFLSSLAFLLGTYYIFRSLHRLKCNGRITNFVRLWCLLSRLVGEV